MDARCYRHPIVRDLAWVIGSPPLIQGPHAGMRWLDRQDCVDALDACQPYLDHLDRDPEPLLTRLAEQPDQRLGHRFETLIACWLEHDPRFDVLAHNLQVQDASGTVGEFDFIVYDHRDRLYLHLEVACKFYLGVHHTEHTASWYGPMLRDRLDRKLDHMQSRQSQLAHHPAARRVLAQHALQVDATRCLMKGRLFYPLAAPDPASPPDVAGMHERGGWCRDAEFWELASNGAEIWQPLSKQHWFSRHAFDPTMPQLDATTLAATRRQLTPPRPQCLAGMARQQGQWVETQRLFLVPDHWGPPDTTS